MRLSDAMEAGYAKVGKQCFGAEFKRLSQGGYLITTCDQRLATQCCALGAARIGSPDANFPFAIREYVMRLNDYCHMPIPEIVEVLRSMGL